MLKKLMEFSYGPIVGAMVGFITVPLITYFISPLEYGKVSVFTLMQSMIAFILYLGMDHSFVREYNEVKNKQQLLTNCIISPLLFSGVLSLIVIVFLKPISIFTFGEVNIKVMILFSILIPFIVIERFLLLTIRMDEKGNLYSFLTITLKVSILICTILCLFKIDKSYKGVVYGTLIGQLIFDISILLIFRKKIQLKIGLIDFEFQKKLFKYGTPFIATELIGWGLNYMDSIFLRIMMDFNSVGIYSGALKIANLLTIFQSCFTTFWVPIALRWKSENKDNTSYEKVNRLVCFFMSIIFIGVLLFKDVIVIILSPEYVEAKYILPFLLFHPLMYTMSETTSLGIIYSKKSIVSVYLSLIALAINLILNFLLTPLMGGRGAAIATGISYIVFFWLRTMVSRKLWFKFNIRYHILSTVILIISSIINTICTNTFIVMIINLLMLLILMVINKEILKDLYNSRIKKIIGNSK